MKSLLIALFIASAFISFSQETSLTWVNQEYKKNFTEKRYTYYLRETVVNKKEREALLCYVSMYGERAILKKISLNTAKEISSTNIKFPFKNTGAYTFTAEINDSLLVLKFQISQDGADIGRIETAVYNYETLVQIKDEKIVNFYSELHENSPLPLDPLLFGKYLKPGNRLNKIKKVGLKRPKYNTNNENEKVFFEGYTENGNQIELKFTSYFAEKPKVSGAIKIKLENLNMLEQVISDSLGNICFLFSEYQINNELLEGYYFRSSRIRTNVYSIIVFDSKKEQTEIKINNIDLVYSNFTNPQMIFSGDKKNLYFGVLCGYDKLSFVNNIINMKTKELKTTITNFNSELNGEVDRLNSPGVNIGKWQYLPDALGNQVFIYQLAGQRTYKSAQMVTTLGQTSFNNYSTIYLSANSIFVLRFNQFGESLSQSLIRKTQWEPYHQKNYFRGYYYKPFGNKDIFLFNDNSENLENLTFYEADIKKPFTVLAEVDKSGKVSKELIEYFNAPEAGYFMAEVAKSISDSELLVFKMDGKDTKEEGEPYKFRVGILSIK